MEEIIQNAASHKTAAFFSLVKHPLKFRLYLLKKLPAAFFSGLKVVQANTDACIVAVPYQWFTRNPFRSTYFASQSMAAELSTGVLAMANLHGQKVSVSMLITGMEAKFHKKAKETIYFTCLEGAKISAAIQASVSTGLGQEVKIYTIGKNAAGERIAEFWFTWSFKAK